MIIRIPLESNRFNKTLKKFSFNKNIDLRPGTSISGKSPSFPKSIASKTTNQLMAQNELHQ